VAPGHAPGIALVAVRGDAVVGAALLAEERAIPGTAAVTVAVAEAERGQGIGGMLAWAVRDRLVQMGAERGEAPIRVLTSMLRDDLPEGRRFAERFGFTVTNHSLGWRLDLATLADGVAERAAETAEKARVRIRLADFDAEERVILDCVARCLAGLPLPYGVEDVDSDRLRDMVPDGAVVLMAETVDDPAGRPCGLTIISPEYDGSVWYTRFTGVDADHRRKGVATALKFASVEAALQAGARAMTSHNDENNKQMLRISEALGADPAVGYWGMARELAADGTSWS
jgi:mycothiol synthase